MEIITIYPRGFGANTYAVTVDGQTAIVIDPSQPRVESELIKRGLKATHVLLTHCHFDHVGGVSVLQESGAKVLCSAEEKGLIATEADLFSLFGAPRKHYAVDEIFYDGEEKSLGDFTVKMLLTPGHTKGSCCYLFTEKDGSRALFTGDTLFNGSIGRTDFPTGNIGQMRESLRKLCKLDGDLAVYPGHNDETTIDNEKRTNPFILDLE
ncbi:MAG: MBL fold metallo-hydrolase [Clostridia bacterium]|nr:MBL fold metallo-hydrolase [Clostridia bacterium]